MSSHLDVPRKAFQIVRVARPRYDTDRAHVIRRVPPLAEGRHVLGRSSLAVWSPVATSGSTPRDAATLWTSSPSVASLGWNANESAMQATPPIATVHGAPTRVASAPPARLPTGV